MGACESSRRKVVFSDLVVNILAILWRITKRFCYLWSQSAVMHQRRLASILHCSSAASQPPASRFPSRSCVCWLALPSKDFAQATGSSFARADRELEALNRYLIGAGGWKPSSSPPVAGTALARDSHSGGLCRRGWGWGWGFACFSPVPCPCFLFPVLSPSQVSLRSTS